MNFLITFFVDGTNYGNGDLPQASTLCKLHKISFVYAYVLCPKFFKLDADESLTDL